MGKGDAKVDDGQDHLGGGGTKAGSLGGTGASMGRAGFTASSRTGKFMRNWRGGAGGQGGAGAEIRDKALHGGGVLVDQGGRRGQRRGPG